MYIAVIMKYWKFHALLIWCLYLSLHHTCMCRQGDWVYAARRSDRQDDDGIHFECGDEL